MSFPGGSEGKESIYNAGDLGSIPGLGRSPGEGNGNPVQYCGLENSMDRGALQATVQAVAELDGTKGLSPPPVLWGRGPTPHSILAWRIPWMEEPGGLQSKGLQRVGDD